jgi:hypothetical protein
VSDIIEPRYLGDGVYASFDGYHIWLQTDSHLEHEATNRIALEPEVFTALVQYQTAVNRAIAVAQAHATIRDKEGGG